MQSQPEECTRDKKAQEKISNDKLCHSTGTLKGISEMLDGYELPSIIMSFYGQSF